ncbi:MAG: hypothetical protein SGJ18_02435 [Pseudomonadota bacterium]|nr:hypothetical protein [Pseudomonadota bacterium]
MGLKVFKGIVSLWIVYHLFVILLFPNSSSLLSRKLDTFLLPYANSLNMNTPWQFFSPWPGPKMYIEYVTYSEKDAVDDSEKGFELLESEKRFFPPKNQRDPDWDNWRRRLYATRFISMEPERLEKTFVAWVCRQSPKMTGVLLEVFFYPVANIEKAKDFVKASDIEDPQGGGVQKFVCPGNQIDSQAPSPIEEAFQ